MSGRRSIDPPGSALVAAIGHAWLRDQSFGIKVVERLRARGVPAGVTLADWSFGAVTALQKLRLRSDERAVFVTATPRGRAPGTLHRYLPSLEPRTPEHVHARVADATTGLVSVDNLLIIAGYYDALPPRVVVVEAEPVDETWGAELSAPLARLVEPAVAAVLDAIDSPSQGVSQGR